MRYLQAVLDGEDGPPMHLHEEAREPGWDDEQLIEAIAYASLEVFTAMVNVAGDVPIDGSVRGFEDAARGVGCRRDGARNEHSRRR